MLELGILAALYVGVFFEGEVILFSAVIAAHHGHMELWAVIVIGFVASVSMDIAFYSIGRSRGATWIRERQSIKAKISRAQSVLEKNRRLIQWTYRFLPVLRTIIPVLLGMDGVPPRLFILQSIVGSIFWAGVIVLLGMLIGESIYVMLGHLEDFELYIIVALALVALVIGIKKYRRHHSATA